jgi:HlyD family secretion protein
MTGPIRRSHHSAIRRYLLAALAASIVLVFGLGGWATTTSFSGAVVAPGTLVVESDVKKVQHPTGGIVGRLFVREGHHVKAGDLLVQLDETTTRANLQIITDSLDEQTARKARLEAERDDTAEIDSSAFAGRGEEPKIFRLVKGEQNLFDFRRRSAEGQKAQLRERILQLREEIDGLSGQVKAKSREIALIMEELKGVRELWDKKLIPITRVTSLERDAARLEGEHGALQSSIAQSKGKISETELQILQVDQQIKTDVAKDLGEVRAKTTELEERKVAAEDQLKRIYIRAPQDGIVHQLTVHTVGGVISQGESIMLIVPDQDTLLVEARIPPPEIDQVHLHARSMLRFTSFNQRTTPTIEGEVVRVSADISQDQKTGQSYYTIRITFTETELRRLGGVSLVPGMPVETFIQTDERTVISYLLKPVHDQVTRAFREK